MENTVSEIVDLLWNNLDLSIFDSVKPSKKNLHKYIVDKVEYQNMSIYNIDINDFISYWKLMTN